MRGVILAAGEGLRLRPFTRSKPKVMLPVGGRPILEFAVEALVAAGVRDVTIVVGYHRERVQSHFEDGNRFGARIRYVEQSSLVGTAHALAQAEPDGPTVVLGGDNVVDEALVRGLLAVGEGPAIAVARSENPSKYGVVGLEGDRVVRIDEKPRESPGDLVSTGVYLLPAGFREFLLRKVKDGVLGLSGVLQAAIEGGTHVRAVRTEGLWMDAVYPWDLLRVNAEILARHPPRERAGSVHASAVIEDLVGLGEGSTVAPHAVVRNCTVLGRNVRVRAGAILENCIVMDDAVIGPGCILQDTIVGEGTRLGARVTAPSGPCEARAEDGWHRLEGVGALVGEDAHVGACVILEPGTTVGNEAAVASGCIVRSNVPDGARVVR